MMHAKNRGIVLYAGMHFAVEWKKIENTIEGNLERHDSGASCYSFFYIDFTAVHK